MATGSKRETSPLTYRQEITLWDGLPRVDLVTHTDFDGSDQLVRLRDDAKAQSLPCASG